MNKEVSQNNTRTGDDSRYSIANSRPYQIS